jgi:vacuolar-type H+-ATPase subunit E/Vma4
MGIEKLSSALINEANEEATKIISGAKAQVDVLVKEERKRESEAKAVAESEINSTLAEQRNERLAWARLEAKRINAEAKEDAIIASTDELYDMVPELRKSSEYKNYLSTSVDAAVKELGGKATVHVLKGEKKLLKVKVPVVEDLDGLGGALVESNDGKMRVDLRLETRFETESDELRRELSAKLFGSKK